MRYLLFILLCFSMTITYSKTMYKCQYENSVAYQFKPCDNEAKQEVFPDQAPPLPKNINAQRPIGNGIYPGDFSVKFDHTDSLGFQWIAYKVMVFNRSNKIQKVFLRYKAVDSEGYLIKEVLLSGTIKPNSYEVLTDKAILNNDEFRRIYKWLPSQ